MVQLNFGDLKSKLHWSLSGACFLTIISCTATAPTRMTEIVSQTSTVSLWVEYRTSNSAIALSLIETELVARGETSFGSSYIGQRTANAFGNELYARDLSKTVSDFRNCSDFPNSAQAQRYFIEAGGPLSDPNNLDGDGDGLACEWGTQIRRISSEARRQASTRQTFTRRCYTGPRGGTYTISSSGARNYGGC